MFSINFASKEYAIVISCNGHFEVAVVIFVVLLYFASHDADFDIVPAKIWFTIINTLLKKSWKC